MARLTSFHTLTVVFALKTDIFILQAVSTTSQKKNANPTSLPTEHPAKLTWRRGKYWGLLNAKHSEGGNGNITIFLRSKAHQDLVMIFLRIFGPRSIYSLGLFFQGTGLGENMERDKVMICFVMDANTNWVAIFFFSS